MGLTDRRGRLQIGQWSKLQALALLDIEEPIRAQQRDALALLLFGFFLNPVP